MHSSDLSIVAVSGRGTVIVAGCSTIVRPHEFRSRHLIHAASRGINGKNVIHCNAVVTALACLG